MKKNCLFLLFAATIMITAGCSSLGVNKPEKTPASPAPAKKIFMPITAITATKVCGTASVTVGAADRLRL